MNLTSSTTSFNTILSSISQTPTETFNNWVEMPTALAMSDQGFDLGGKTTYYDGTSGIIYLTLGGETWGDTNIGTYYGRRGNVSTGRGYNIAGYNTNTNQMFVLANTPFTMAPTSSTDHIINVNGNIWITSKGVPGNVVIYNPQTGTWTAPANITTSTVNARVQMLAYDAAGNTIYMAGNFTSASTGNYLTKYNLISNTLSKISCNGASAPVSQIIFDPINRKLFVGATSISNANTSSGTVATLSGNGVCIYNVSSDIWENVRVDMSGSVTSFCGDFGNNLLYVGMSGNTAGVSPNNNTTNGLGVLNTTSYTWGNIGLTKSLIIGTRKIACATCMEMYRGNLIVGGGFTGVNNNANINYAFKYKPTENVISKITNNWFYVGSANTTTCITSFAIDQSSGTVYAQGKFGFPSTYNIKYFGFAGGILRYDRTNDVLIDTNLYVQTTGIIRAHYQIDSGNIFIAGGYTNISGGTFTNAGYKSHFHKWNINTNVFVSYGTVNEPNGVIDMVYNPTNQYIYLIGLFTSVQQANGTNISSSGIIKFNTQTGTFTAIAAGITNLSTAALRIMQLDVSNQLIYFRSAKNTTPYTTYGGVSNQYGFAVFNINTETWTNLSVPANVNIACMYLQPYTQKIYATFLSATSTFHVYDIPSNSWTALPGLTNTLQTYAGNYWRYMDMDISNNILFISGSFYSISGQTHYSGVVSYDLNTNTASRIGSTTNMLNVNLINYIMYDSSENCLYVMGGFPLAGNKKIVGVAKYNFASNEWNSIFSSSKYCLMGYREGTINASEGTERNQVVNYMMFINDTIYLQTNASGFDASYNFINMAKTIIN